MLIVTARLLKRKDACREQVDLFAATFGPNARVEITEALCVEHAGKFDWGWAAANLLPAPLNADYKAKRALLDADYRAKRAPLNADYEAKRALLYADYEAKRALLDADYEAKRAPLDADYKAKRALLFGRLAESMGAGQ